MTMLTFRKPCRRNFSNYMCEIREKKIKKHMTLSSLSSVYAINVNFTEMFSRNLDIKNSQFVIRHACMVVLLLLHFLTLEKG